MHVLRQTRKTANGVSNTKLMKMHSSARKERL